MNWARFYFAVIYIVEISLLIKMSILTILSIIKRICVTFSWLFCYIYKINSLIIILSFKIQGASFLKEASVDALDYWRETSLFTQRTISAKPSSASTEASFREPNPWILKLKIIINELILYMKQNNHENVTQILFITDKIVRIDIFINKLISAI